MIMTVVTILLDLVGIFLIIYGLVGLIRGKLGLSKQKSLTGKQARWVSGGLMVLGVILLIIFTAITQA
jgi:hypothetical protein